MPVSAAERFAWDPASTYVRQPPFFVDLTQGLHRPADITGARVLAWVGDSVTTDHISPAGAIPTDSPAGRYLIEHGVKPADFNTYGARRGNHEVMIRGTFANIRLRNQLAGDREGGWTTHLPSGELVTIYEAALRYQQAAIPLLVIAGKEYGSGSSRPAEGASAADLALPTPVPPASPAGPAPHDGRPPWLLAVPTSGSLSPRPAVQQRSRPPRASAAPAGGRARSPRRRQRPAG